MTKELFETWKKMVEKYREYFQTEPPMDDQAKIKADISEPFRSEGAYFSEPDTKIFRAGIPIPLRIDDRLIDWENYILSVPAGVHSFEVWTWQISDRTLRLGSFTRTTAAPSGMRLLKRISISLGKVATTEELLSGHIYELVIYSDGIEIYTSDTSNASNTSGGGLRVIPMGPR